MRLKTMTIFLRPALVAIAFLVSACGAQSGATTEGSSPVASNSASTTTSSSEVPSFRISDLTVEGGCAQVVFAANKEWTQVVEISIQNPRGIEAGVPTEVAVGEGVEARLITGENMSNLFCNDVIEGDEVTDVIYPATSGSVTITLDQPFDNSGNERVVAQVTTSDLVFDTRPSETHIEWLDITAAIGWYPG